MNLTFLITVPIIFLLNFYLIGKFFLKKNLSEQIIFGFVVYIWALNYIFFYTNISSLYVLIFFFICSLIHFLKIIFFKKNLKDFYLFFFILLVINILISLIAIAYGPQFYVFRGNIYDNFSYFSIYN